MSELSIQWLIVFVDASVKAALVALVAAAGLALLRVRDSNLRHRVWTGVLCGMLLLPLLTQIVPALRLPITVNPEWFAVLNRTEVVDEPVGVADLSNDDAAISAVERTPDRQPDSPELEPTASGDGLAMDGRSDWPGARRRWAGNMSSGSLPSPAPSDDALADDPPSPPASAAATALAAPEPAVASRPAAVPPILWQVILSHLPITFWALWLAGVLVLTLRLGVGLWMARALRRASRPIALSDLPAPVMILPTVAADTNPTRERGSQDIPSLALRVSMPRRDVPVLACPLIRVPLTLGVLRPQILLPLDWIDWSAEKLQAVLAHERTHAERGDCAMALLAEVNRCVYWFHPLAWWLRRRLASLAEAACDDAAIGSTGDRASYARHLLEVAATARAHRGRLIAGSVSMARRSNVETRIAAILDFKRPLSQRLTRGTALVLVGSIVPLIALAAALRPSNGRVEESLPTAVALDQSPPTETEDLVLSTQYAGKSTQESSQDKPESTTGPRADDPRTADSKLSTEYSVPSTQSPGKSKPASRPDADVTFKFAGTVVDERQQPVAGAKVALSYFRKDPSAPETVPAVLTDNRGRFDFSSKRSDFSDRGERLGHALAKLIATKEGLGFAVGLAMQFETTGGLKADLTDAMRAGIEEDCGKWSNVLTMVPDDVPVRGRILSVEGKPVAGAKIEAVWVLGGEHGTLEAWEMATKKHGANFYSTFEELKEFANGHSVSGPQAAVVPPVHTDAEGRFILKGLGRERMAELFVSGQGIETTMFYVRSRQGEVIKLPENERSLPGLGDPVYYPAEFTRVVGPSVAVTGRVTDSRSKQPVPGIAVTAHRIASSATGGTFLAAHIRTVTDADGRYQLYGLPLGNNELLALPPFGSRHLPIGFPVKTAAGSKPQVRDIGLTAGIFVRGRVIDERTKKPVQGRLSYFIVSTNPNLEEADGVGDASLDYHYRSNEDGRFEIPALPGKGILAFTADDHEDFPRGSGADRIDVPLADVEGARFIFKTEPYYCLADNFHVLTSIDPEPGTAELTIALTLKSGVTVPGRVLAPDGQALRDYCVLGGGYGGWDSHNREAFEIKAYFAHEGRRLAFFHPGHNLVGQHDLIGEPPEKLDVTLEPGATLVGRVVDADGLPLENATIDDAPRIVREMDGHSALRDHRRGMLPPGLDGRPVLTDAQGRFELKGIIPGLKYSAEVSAPMQQSGTTTHIILGPIFADVIAKPGETKQLGDLRVVPEGADAGEKPATKPPLDPPVDGGKKDSPLADPGKTKSRATPNGETKSSLSTEYPGLTTQADTPNDTRLTYAGTVVGPDGKSVAGAKLHFWYFTREPHPDLRPLAITAADGTFRFSQHKSDFDKLGESGDAWKSAAVVAVADGYGFAIKDSAVFETTGIVRAAQTTANSGATDNRIALNAGSGKSRRVRFFGRNGGSIVVESNPTKTAPPEQVVVLTKGINVLLDVAEVPAGKPTADTIDLSADRVVIWADADSARNFGGEISQTVESPLRMCLDGNVVIRQGKNVLRASRVVYDVHQSHAHALDAPSGGRPASLRQMSSLNWEQFAAAFVEPVTNVIRLIADDAPVRARIVDVEGRPLAGARLDVMEVWQSKDETLQAWEQEASRPGAVDDLRHEGWVHLMNGPRAAVVASMTRPDRDGWIQINGLGKERVAKVQLSGPGIESAVFHVRTRRGNTIRLARDIGRSMGDEIYHPAEFTHAAGPSQPVTGTITAAKTGAPLAGCIVQGDLKSSADGRSFYQFGKVTAKTDAAGRYRLEGLTPGDQRLVVLPPRGSEFLPTAFTLKTGAKRAAVAHDAQLFAGVRLHGTITDGRTGKPIAASLSYQPFSNNPAAKSAVGLELVTLDLYYFSTDAQGRFELAALPGKGVLAITAHNHDSYPIGAGFKTAKAQAAAAGAKAEFNGYANLITVVDLAAETECPSVDLTLDPGRTIPGTVTAPDGTVLVDYLIYGGSQYPFWNENKGDAFQVQGYFANEKRRLMFYHPARNLIGVSELAGEPPEMLKIVLRPGAVLKGRIVDGTGLPLEDAEIVNANAVMASPMAVRPVDDPTRGVLATRFDKASVLRTGTDGRFELRGIIPGLKYSAAVFGRTNDRRDHLGKLFTDVTVEPGEVKDLGDLVPNREAADPPAGLAPDNDDADAEAADDELPIPEPKADPVKAEKPEQAKSGAAPVEPTEPGNAKTQQNVAGDALPRIVSVIGIVLKPDGSPAAGATVRAAAPLWAMVAPIVGADFKSPMSELKTDAQGRFSISFPTQPFGDLGRVDERWQEIWKKTTIAASLDRFGPAWVVYEEIATQKSVTLRLVEDLPVRGRVVDLEGRPVAGAGVKLSDLRTAAGDDLSAWIDGIKAGELPWTVYDKARRSIDPRLIGLPGLLTTGADGMIELHGMGRERLVQLTFEGESVAHRSATLVTRKMDSIRRTISAPPFEGTEPVFGAEFTFTADPARPIEGVVRDAQSGEVLAGVSVESYKLVGYPYSNNRVLKTKTDKLGRFRLTGMPKGSGNRLLLVPNDEQPYFMREVEVPDPVGLGPAKMEIELHRGIWISGRVTDKATGDPVPGVRLHYLPFRTNDYAQKTPEFDSNGNVNGDQMRYVTKPDGTYRLVGLPGRAIIGAESVLQNYRRGVGYDAIDAPKHEKTDHFDTYRNPINPGPKWPSVMREINPTADAETVSLDLQLDPGQSLRIRVVGPDGEPVRGVSVTGLSSDGYLKASQEPILIAANFGPAETRIVLLHHEEQKIGRVVTIGREQLKAGELTVELQPCATLIGRILNSDGLPITGMAIRPDVLPSGDFSKQLPNVATDSEGRFHVTLLPGCKYSFGGEGGGFRFVTVARELSIEPGETKDLGTLTIDKDGKVMRQAASGPAKAAVPSTESSVLSTQSPARNNSASGKPNADAQKASAITISGTIQTPDRKPVAKAFVAAIGMRRQAGRGGDLISNSAVLGESITDDDGRYRMQLSGVSSRTHVTANLIARTDGSGLAWKRLDPDARDVEASFELPAEQVIRGRFVDIEGQPASNVTLSVKSVVVTVKSNGDANLGTGYYDFDNPPQAWPPTVVADNDGKFTIYGIPAGHGVYLGIAGTDRIARQGLSINTGASESRPQNDATYRYLVRNFKPGEEVVLPLAPAQIFDGVVRYADTNEPAPHARLTIWASQQQFGGSMISVAGKADVHGRYRINPYPGVRFGITAYPADGMPYLVRQITDITRKDGALVKQVDVSLPRGVLVRGHVVESGTKRAVAAAAVQYIPESFNNPNAKDDIITGWQGIQPSEESGAFAIAVLPGPGRLLVNGPTGEFVAREIGYQQLERGLPGGERTYAHAFERINPEANSDPIEMTVELQRGATVVGRITNAAGEPVEHALLLTRLNLHPSELTWRGFPIETLGGRFELSGLAQGVEYPTYFLDEKNRLGATLKLKADDSTPAAVLLPCGEALATFVDKTGKPVADFNLNFEIVLTSGTHRFDLKAMRLNSTAAEATYVQNVDRTNYRSAPQSDAQGRVTLPALIPGARYRIITYANGGPAILKEFVAESQKTLDLGKITIDVPKEE